MVQIRSNDFTQIQKIQAAAKRAKIHLSGRAAEKLAQVLQITKSHVLSKWPRSNECGLGMYLLSLLLPVFYSIAIAHPIQDRLKRSLILTREEQKYFSKIEPFCNHTQEAYTSINISTRLYDFNDPTNAAIASICK
jgi:hypothetical protein